MLARPEAGSRAHIKLWVNSKDPSQKYRWSEPSLCACGQYWEEFGDTSKSWQWRSSPNDKQFAGMLANLREGNQSLNMLAMECQNFGQLADVLEHVWNEELVPA